MNDKFLMVAMAALAVGCGGGLGSTPWDQNEDGLIAACEGLSKDACGKTQGCHGEELACLAVCFDDGKGSCESACKGRDGFQCVADRCEDLDANQCASNPSCQLDAVYCSLVCESDGRGGCLPCPGSPVCRTKPEPDCSSHPAQTCNSDPRCEVRAVTVCEAHDAPVAKDLPGCGGGCTTTLQCAPKLPSDCASRDLEKCEADHACRVIAWACPAICEDDGSGGCKPCPEPAISCVPAVDEPPRPEPTQPPTK